MDITQWPWATISGWAGTIGFVLLFIVLFRGNQK